MGKHTGYNEQHTQNIRQTSHDIWKRSTRYGQQLYPESPRNNTEQRPETNNRRCENHTNPRTPDVYRPLTNHPGNKTTSRCFPDKNQSTSAEHLDTQDTRPTAPQDTDASLQRSHQLPKPITDTNRNRTHLPNNRPNRISIIPHQTLPTIRSEEK